MLRCEPLDVGLDFRVGFVALQELLHARAGVPKQRCVDELDGRRRALDVQQDRADVRQRDAVRRGMYVGPMQSGWYPRSAPLLV